MKRICSLLLLALIVSCSDAKNSRLPEDQKSKNVTSSESASEERVLITPASDTTPEEDPIEYSEDDNLTGDMPVSEVLESEEVSDFIVESQDDQGQVIVQDDYVAQSDIVEAHSQDLSTYAENLCDSLPTNKTGDYMLTSILEQGHTELNSNVACIVRTAYTPEKVSLKMLANIYEYEEFNNFDDQLDFVIGDENLCAFKRTDLVDRIRKQAALNGCQADVHHSSNSKTGVNTIHRVVVHSCSEQYGFQKCNRFKQNLKTCLKTNDDTIKIDFTKARELNDGESQVYYVRLDQKGKSKRKTDFTLLEVTGNGTSENAHIKRGGFLRSGDSFRVRTEGEDVTQ